MKENYDDEFMNGYNECTGGDRRRDMESEVAMGKVVPAFAVGYEVQVGILANGGLVSSDILANEIGELCVKYRVNPSDIKESISNLSGNDDPDDFFELVKDNILDMNSD